MNKVKVVQKAEAGEGLTVAEIKVYQKTVKPENTDVFNTVIAFRMLEIMRNNGLIDESEYAKVEKKRARYKGNVIDKRKTKKAVIQYD